MQYSLVIQTSFLGDVVLTTPLIAELAQRGPVHVVTTPAGAPLLARNPDVSALTIYDKRGSAKGVGGLANVAAELNGARTRAASVGATDGVAYLAQGSVRSATLAKLAGFRTRVGFTTSAGRWLYTRRVAYRDDRHHAERLWSLGAVSSDATPTREQLRPRLFPGGAEREAVDRLFAGLPLGGGPLVALAPGSVWATKRWPFYPDLARALPSHARIVVIGAKDDTPLASDIAAAAPGRVLDATGQLSLLGSAELLARCTVLVTNDSAPQHLGSAVGIPTVTVFGPTVPEFGFGPLAPRSATAGVQGLECRPCDKHGPMQCPLGHWRCMRDLAATSVAEIVARVQSGRS
ncbi:MAG TPA: glycosyltransferase family 9 protein [Gemmatimonadaceae bacterium]|nr:glycosyltransferase family 9 protein [Gemmatimonadaceae bacterium]